ncbi:MAG: sporulation protein YhbH [Chloroflexi bacterium]|nr:MAG: sporulation protein YhbH [Chloroflexota bacterium]
METFSLSHDDWSLHRKGIVDQARHKQKVKEAIRRNLADIVSEQSIITSDGKRLVRVPIRTLEQYKFRYDPNDKRGVGQGDGNTKVGDILERYGKSNGNGSGQQAGDQPGVDFYEAEITFDELAALVFEDLSLPNLEERRVRELPAETVRFTDIRRSGPFSNLDKRRTIRENLRRNALQGRRGFGRMEMDDLRFKTWERDIRRESNAVVFAMMDVSGSMGAFEKYVSRAFYYWMVRFLRTRYDSVEIVFIAHHTEAKQVSEEEFFTKGESGGTKASSAYQLALDLVEQTYRPDDWNIYPFHFSDGDNWPSDNEVCVRLATELLRCSNLFGYGEIRQTRSTHQSSLMQALRRLESPKFVTVSIGDKADVHPALTRFFGANAGKEAQRGAA